MGETGRAIYQGYGLLKYMVNSEGLKEPKLLCLSVDLQNEAWVISTS